MEKQICSRTLVVGGKNLTVKLFQSKWGLEMVVGPYLQEAGLIVPFVEALFKDVKKDVEQSIGMFDVVNEYTGEERVTAIMTAGLEKVEIEISKMHDRLTARFTGESWMTVSDTGKKYTMDSLAAAAKKYIME